MHERDHAGAGRPARCACPLRSTAGACTRCASSLASVSAAFAASSAGPWSGCDARANWRSSCGHSTVAVSQYFSARSRRLPSLIATRLVAASASPISRAASTGSRLAISSSHGATLARRISGGFAGWESRGGSESARAMAGTRGERRALPGDCKRSRGAGAPAASAIACHASARATQERDDRIDLIRAPASSARGRRPRIPALRARSARGHLRARSRPTAGPTPRRAAAASGSGSHPTAATGRAARPRRETARRCPDRT